MEECAPPWFNTPISLELASRVSSSEGTAVLPFLMEENPEIGFIVPIGKAKMLIPEIEVPSGCN